jgi:NAD(P)-dependent dehydrogenase (short-subunit alcohol dehydrogenase family)
VELAGRWALVTGAAKRVGRVVAHELAGRGAHVIVHYHTSDAAAGKTVASLQALGVRAEALRADLADPAAVRRLADDAEALSGGVALLVNSASNYLRTPFDTITDADWDASLDVNLKAPFLLATSLGRAMRARGEGCIVNVADWAGERPYRNYLPYCVSKAGLIALTRALAKELAPAVRVNAVSPGPVLLPEDFGPDAVAAVTRATPLGRVGTPEDVARAIRFLAEEAAFSTGAVLHVDGGRGIA